MCGQQKWAIEYIPDGGKIEKERNFYSSAGLVGQSSMKAERYTEASF